MRLNFLHFVHFFLLSSFLPVFELPAQTFSLPLKPQPESYVFKEIKLQGDAPIRDVRALLQDKRGFVWMAGRHGLLRYDGHDFKIFRYKPGDTNSIVDTDLLSLYLHGETLLCIGGVHGISLMDIRTEKILNLMHDQEGIPVEHVSQFFPDRDGTIWIAALNGLYSLKADFSGIINHHLNLPPLTKGNPAFAKRVYCITENSTNSNLLMLGTECGLISFDKKRNALYKTYPNTQATFWRSQPGVYKLEKEGDYLWTLCWISGMPRFNMRTENWENLAYPRKGDRLETTKSVWAVSDFMIKNENEIWVCDYDRGLFVFDKKRQQLQSLDKAKNCAVLSNFRMQLFRLDDGALWLSNKDGLWKQNQRASMFREPDIPFSHEWISSVLHDEETAEYYFGLNWESYGVACWNSLKKDWIFYRPESGKDEMFSTYDVFKDSRGVIWIATARRGLWYVDKQKKLLKPFIPPDENYPELWQGTIYKVFEDSRKNLWLGTGKYGVVRLNPDHTQAVYYKNMPGDTTSLIAGTHFRTIEEDRYGKIWIGSRSGFCTFNPETGMFSREIAEKLYKTGVRKSDTYSIVKDTTGAMWLTITGQGLVRIDENSKGEYRFKTLQTDDGLKDLTVKFMTKDKQGGLWIVNNGLLYLNPYTGCYMLTDKQNGLVENIGGDDNVMVDRYGNVFCGEQVGLGWLTEAGKYLQSSISNLIIENISINGRSVEDWNPYHEKTVLPALAYNRNNFTFSYTAICFEDYDQVRYRYKLEGLEDKWNPPTNVLEARYTNLKPGKYRFVVDAAYKGNWLGYNRIVCFEIRQVFWKTGWFAALVLLFVAAAFFDLYLNRKRYREKQKRIRLKIASDLHDDMGSTLSSISIMSDLLQSEPDNKSTGEEMIRKIGENAKNMLESMDDIIWAVNPQNDDFRYLIARIREYAIPLFETRDIRFAVHAPESILSLHIPMEIRRNLFLIAKEAVNNTVKYSDCTQAVVDFSYSHSILKMTVADDGKGFDTSKDYGRNGLRNMKFRGNKIGGKVTVHSATGKGTMVTLVVKIGKNRKINS